MTTTEEVIRLAREAGFVLSDNATDESIGRFLLLIDLGRAEENEIVQAAENLIKQKGRHNTEIAYRRLEEAIRARRTA